jgi:alpha 1,2-mannosyltransferase
MGFMDAVVSGLFGQFLDHSIPFDPSLSENQSGNLSTSSSSSRLYFTSSLSASPRCDPSMSSPGFWKLRSSTNGLKWFQIRPAAYRFPISKRQIAAFTVLILIAIVWFVPPPQAWIRSKTAVLENGIIPRPVSIVPSQKKAPDPSKWLQENSGNKYVIGRAGRVSVVSPSKLSKNPRAALISLVRNSELPGLIQSMRQLEYHWNHKYQYPWIFFNDEPFSDEFRVFPSLSDTLCPNY